jgi:hypothetical protein
VSRDRLEKVSANFFFFFVLLRELAPYWRAVTDITWRTKRQASNRQASNSVASNRDPVPVMPGSFELEDKGCVGSPTT